MKKFIQSIALMAFVITSVSVSAQEKISSAENPEVMRYVKALELNEKQEVQLKEIYSKSEMQLKANQDEMTKLRMERVDNQEPKTAEEKAAWNERMDKTSKEQRMLVDERNKQMLDILTDEQMAKYKEMKQTKADVKSEEMPREEPAKEASPLKKATPQKR
jgi:hypothetical protein